MHPAQEPYCTGTVIGREKYTSTGLVPGARRRLPQRLGTERGSGVLAWLSWAVGRSAWRGQRRVLASAATGSGTVRLRSAGPPASQAAQSGLLSLCWSRSAASQRWRTPRRWCGLRSSHRSLHRGSHLPPCRPYPPEEHHQVRRAPGLQLQHQVPLVAQALQHGFVLRLDRLVARIF